MSNVRVAALVLICLGWASPSVAQQLTEDRWCAMKIIRKDVVIKLKQVEHTLHEKNILSCVNCPFIIHLWEFFQVREAMDM